MCDSDTLATISRKFLDFTCEGDGVITTLCEQIPDKRSRVYLGDSKDSLGQRKLVVDWNVNETDKRTIRILALEAAKELARLDVARVKIHKKILDQSGEYYIGGHCHQMGTTRMAANMGDGVVDSNSKVFGIDNLFLAGSSIFSTGGAVNPTFSVVQLSIRLAEHLSHIHTVA